MKLWLDVRKRMNVLLWNDAAHHVLSVSRELDAPPTGYGDVVKGRFLRRVGMIPRPREEDIRSVRAVMLPGELSPGCPTRKHYYYRRRR